MAAECCASRKNRDTGAGIGAIIGGIVMGFSGCMSCLSHPFRGEFPLTPSTTHFWTLRNSLFSGRAAEINREVGGAFSLFNGHIIGRNLELIPNKRIVQAWRVVDWPEGVYSIARFELRPDGSGTHLVFDHKGFPEELRDHLAEGWEANYWSLLKKYFR